MENVYQVKRRKTVEVTVGELKIGSGHPIRIQSMVTVNTLDTENAVLQIKALSEAGCELVRLTTPGINEAKNLENIKKELQKLSINVPLAADIHFTPNAAMVAAEFVEKIRINPGNFYDRKRLEKVELTDKEYSIELEKIQEAVSPLINKLKPLGRALRIGTNHGSLSGRITTRFGDTPPGMVESAMEYLRICETHSFYNIVLSMKSSNPRVMVEAYRLLVKKMNEEDMRYPLHLGVTEAGGGLDGRIKSAAGIGTLLEEGLGDTIRVSLTEDPVNEIPVARSLADAYSVLPSVELSSYPPYPFIKKNFKRRRADNVSIQGVTLGGSSPVRTGILINDVFEEDLFFESEENISSPEMIFSLQNPKYICVLRITRQVSIDKLDTSICGKDSNFVLLLGEISDNQSDIQLVCESLYNSIKHLQGKGFCPIPGLLIDDSRIWVPAHRYLAGLLSDRSITAPIILISTFSNSDRDILLTSAKMSTLLMDGIGDAICFVRPRSGNYQKETEVMYTILQATRRRISKTEFISCPSCGRTHFDLEEVTKRIQRKTSHLKGLKIAVMGCIVNGPGEMADADFGYIGAARGMISLYSGKKCVKKNIPESEAINELIGIIKSTGKWRNP